MLSCVGWRVIVFCFSVVTAIINCQADQSPFKAEAQQDRYRLIIKDGVKYANYTGMAASLGMAMAHAQDPVQYFFIAGGALNVFSAAVDPEKHPKFNIALAATNTIWGIAHVWLLGSAATGVSTVSLVEEIAWVLYWAAKGTINIANVVYRAGFVKQKK